jgi:hypothetical protein
VNSARTGGITVKMFLDGKCLISVDGQNILKVIPECYISVFTPGGLGSEVFAW